MSSWTGVDREAWKALFAAQAGWMLDAMDFLLFTFALRAIQQEFQLTSAVMGTLTTVALLAAAVGGIAFGHLADRIGRVRALSWSIVVYSVATAGLATSQNLAHLFFWRIVVGVGMGGEWSSGSVLVAESWPPEHRAKAAGIMQSGWALGALAAAGLSALFLERLGWRFLFLLGIVPALLALVIRMRVREPEIWSRRSTSTSAFGEMFRPPYLRRTVVASLVASCVLIAYWGLITWLPTFLSAPPEKGGVGLTITRTAGWTVALQLGALVGYLSFGWLADRGGRRTTFTIFMVGAAIVIPLYAHFSSQPATLLLLGPVVGFFAHGYFSVFGALLSELFPTRIRATAQGFCYNAGRVASAAAPYLIAVAAERRGFASALMLNALFFALAGIVVWFLPETRATDLKTLEMEGA
jgi:MFS family permease